jgi:Uma2 family endonuclease
MTAARPIIPKRFSSVNSFEKWANRQEAGYEFANKKVIEKDMIKNYELLIIFWLNRFFRQTRFFLEGGELISEVGMKLPKGNFRIPDLAYFTSQQIEAAAQDQYPIPALAIEFLSDSEGFADVENKLNDYFEAGVQVVWYINPINESIYCYRSLKEIEYLKGNDICSASPVMPDFKFETKAIFKKTIH